MRQPVLITTLGQLHRGDCLEVLADIDEGSVDLVDQRAWDQGGPCLYLVGASDGGVRYVGISKNRLKDRWRMSPAYDVEAMERLPRNQLFHSQCWRYLQDEICSSPGSWYEIRVIAVSALRRVLAAAGSPLSDHTGEPDVLAAVESFIRRNRSADLARWNAR